MSNCPSTTNRAPSVAAGSGILQIRSWLRERCGIDYPDHKISLLRSRLERVADRHRIPDLELLAHLVQGDTSGDIAARVVQAASTNHTFFFRETQVLENIVTTILPNLSAKSEIRIWSAAASTGDEAYTVAIMAAEALGLEVARSRIVILGTDISAPVIAAAERGVYGPGQLENLTPDLLRRYFQPVAGGEFKVSDEIRGMCTFRRMNLKARPLPFRRPFDIVLCRNILYYFDRDDQTATLQAIHDATQSGGWLLTSVTETIRGLSTPWKLVAPGLYRSSK